MGSAVTGIGRHLNNDICNTHGFIFFFFSDVVILFFHAWLWNSLISYFNVTIFVLMGF